MSSTVKVLVSIVTGRVEGVGDLYPDSGVMYLNGEWSHISHEKALNKVIVTAPEEPLKLVQDAPAEVKEFKKKK